MRKEKVTIRHTSKSIRALREGGRKEVIVRMALLPLLLRRSFAIVVCFDTYFRLALPCLALPRHASTSRGLIHAGYVIFETQQSPFSQIPCVIKCRSTRLARLAQR